MYAFCLLATAVAFRGPASQVAPARAAPLLRGAVEDHVTQRAEDLLMAIVKDKTALGNDIKRNNQRTGGSAVLEGVTLERCDADGLDMTCVVRRRVGGFGRKFETGDERANATWADLLPDDAAAAWAGGADAQRRLMQVACGLELPGAAARLLDAAFPGGLGDAGRLPDNLWLNNIPASKLARGHMSDACVAGVLDALGAPGAPSTLAVTIKPPELDVEMDTYRIGTLLELVRSLTFAIISERGERVRVAVQAPMGEGIFAGMPLSLNGVRKLLSLMDWGPDAAQLMDDGYVRFGAVSGRPEDVDDKDDVFVLVAPQSIVGSSIVEPLRDMVDAAGRRKVITINANLDDIQSSQGVSFTPASVVLHSLFVRIVRFVGHVLPRPRRAPRVRGRVARDLPLLARRAHRAHLLPDPRRRREADAGQPLRPLPAHGARERPARDVPRQPRPREGGRGGRAHGGVPARGLLRGHADAQGAEGGLRRGAPGRLRARGGA